MKDWEISETYVLPRIYCLRTAHNALLGKQSKPNLRFFSLNENSSEWTTWKRSDYFYPEMIPEPDYSDSGDDAETEDDEDDRPSIRRDPRSAFERLRELTEVYVSNVDLKKAPGKPKKADSKRVGPTPKDEAKQTKGTSKNESGKPVKPTGKAPQAKKSPPTSPKTPAKGSPSTTRADKSPKTAPKSPPKTKSPPSVPKSSKPTPSKASPSAVKKSTPVVSEGKKEISPSASKTKPVSKPKSPPPTPPKTKAAKPAAKGKASPKTTPKSKAASKKPAGGDATSRQKETDKTPISSPSRSKSRSPVSSAASEEQSSDDELIKPKKPVNPYMQSTERQQLHKELKFSQKYGKLGASSKTELQLALERYTENKMKRELNAEEKTSLEKILEFQAKKIEMQETMDKSPAWLDRLQKPPSPMSDPKTDEFYRVHARVVSSNILAHCFLSDDDRSDCSSPRKFQYSDSGSDS